MTQAHDPQTALHPFGPDMFGLSGMVTPALILLRAELLALEQMLPGYTAQTGPDHDAEVEAETDNLPV